MPVSSPSAASVGTGKATVRAAANGMARPSATVVQITCDLSACAARRIAASEMPTGIWCTRMPRPTSHELIAKAFAPTPSTKPSAQLWIMSPTTNGRSACLRTCSSGEWWVWAWVNASVRNRSVKPPTKPTIAGPLASSRLSGKRSTNDRASKIPAAKAAEYALPPAPSSPPNNARRLAPAKPPAASTAIRMAFISVISSHGPRERAPLATPRPEARSPAIGASAVDLDAVRVDLEARLLKETEIQGALVELGDIAAGLADQVVVMVLCQLVTRTIPQIKATQRSDLREEVEGAVDRHQSHLRTAGTDLLEALVLLCSQRS